MSSSALDQLSNALKRLPAQLGGSPVDLANIVLGAVSGRGLSGFSAEPALGSAHLARIAGLPAETGGVVGDSAEAVLGLASPAGATKSAILGGSKLAGIVAAGGAAGGMILPARATHSMADIVAASKMEIAGKDAKEIYDRFTRTDPTTGAITGGLFKGSSQVDAIRVGWKGIIDDSSATFKQGALERVPDYYEGVKTSRVMFGPKPGQTLRDILDHPRLTDAMEKDPAMKKILDAKIELLPSGDRVVAHYRPGLNTIGLSSTGSTKDLMSWLLHETQHAVQFETGMGQGANSSNFFKHKPNFDLALENAKNAVTSAKDKKAFEQADTDYNALMNVKNRAYAKYNQTQGEVEARTTENMFVDQREILKHNPAYPSEAVGNRDSMTKGSEYLHRKDKMLNSDFVDTDPSIVALVKRYQ